MFGFYRIACGTPCVHVADVEKNCENILKLFFEASQNQASLVIFPELTLTGYTCGDLFFQTMLIDSVQIAVEKIVKATAESDTILIFGLPFKYRDILYNTAIAVQKGKILALVPKQNLPNYKEFNEKRYFTSGEHIVNQQVRICNQDVIFSKSLMFSDDKDFTFGIELCEDLWSISPPSTALIQSGAKLICNLAASTEAVGKHNFRTDLIKTYSARGVCAYAFCSAGVGESVSDSVFAGHTVIAESGAIKVNNRAFMRENQLHFADIDFQKLSFERICETSYDAQIANAEVVPVVNLSKVATPTDLKYSNLPLNPFLGPNEAENRQICDEIVAIQANALASRMSHTGVKSVLLGLSGGLDSTLALLVCYEACKILKRNPSDIIAITMPGFGTTDRTYNNALILATELGVTLKEISIKAAVLQHFNDIEHDPKVIDVTYENSQARERTQILMDLANKYQGLVIGTGDLSEIALGWCTYNGDHMAMYSVNASIPKTLIRYIITNIANYSSEKLKKTLIDIVATPVSPELLPSDSEGKIAQKTEDIIGPYELHDFFLFHFIKRGADAKKLEYLANCLFYDKFSPELIRHTLKTFIRRFFSQQFKRNCMPEGPKATSISLSPRGDWQMPSESLATLWLNQLD